MNIQSMQDIRDKHLAACSEKNGADYATMVAETATTLALGDEIYATLGMLGTNGDAATEAMRELVGRSITMLGAMILGNKEDRQALLCSALDDARAMMKEVDSVEDEPVIVVH